MFGFLTTDKTRPARWGNYHEISEGQSKDGDSDHGHPDGFHSSSDKWSSWLGPRILALLMAMNVLLSGTLLLVWITRGTETITTTTATTENSNKAPDITGSSAVQLLGQAGIPVSMERFRFQTGVRKQFTPFFGPRNATTDAAWGGLLNAGLVRITKSQADQLSAPTARSRQDPSFYVGIVEVFHQLHCLGHLRTVIYAPDPTIERMKNPGHADHCLEYLRQTLSCLADVEIAPIGFDSKQNSYAIRDDTVRQCRAFETIHEWVLDPTRHELEDA